MLIAVMLTCYVLWICGPLIPATIIYKLAPNEPIGLAGPLGNLKINASGAFAAYIIVFSLASPIVSNMMNTVTGMVNPAWTVSARVRLQGENGSAPNPQLIRGLVVQLRPDIISTIDEHITATVPEINHKFPKIWLNIPNFGSHVID